MGLEGAGNHALARRQRRAASLTRRAAGLASLAALSLTVAACSDPGAAYLETQASIQSTLNSEHMAVRSVTCTPQVGTLAWTDPPAHLHCRVDFKNGTSYSTPAKVQPVVDQPDALTWYGPPSGLTNVYVASAPLPRPSSSLAATSAGSLFYASNLRPVVAAIDKRFGGQSIVQLALYPGELETVIVDANNQARLVTANASGKLTVGPPLAAHGSLNAIYPSQLDAAVPERLAAVIAQRGRVSTSRIARFVLYFKGQNAGWNIYLLSGASHFEAPLTGGAVKALTPSGVRSLH